MKPLVSIIIRCHKQANFLAYALDNTLTQTYVDWECIIVNDGSPDNTREVAMEYLQQDKRFRYVEQDNSGLSAARNAGIRAAIGRYIQFLDADDLLEIHKLRNHVAYLEANLDVDIVYGDARYFPDSDPSARELGPYADASHPWIPRLWHEPGTLLEKFLKRNIFPVNSAIIRSDVFKRVGYLNEGLQALEDWEFWTRYAGLGLRFKYIDGDQSFALIRMHPSSMTRDTSRMDRAYMGMLVVLGESVPHKIKRHANFLRGCQLGGNLSPSEFRLYVLRLAKANWTATVGMTAFVLLAKLYTVSAASVIRSKYLRTYQRVALWSLQQGIHLLLKRERK